MLTILANKTVLNVNYSTCVRLKKRELIEALPGGLEIQGEGPFIFRELGSTSKYFKGSGEQKKDLGGLREQKKKTFMELRKNKPGSWGRRVNFSGSREQRPPPPSPDRPHNLHKAFSI